LAIPLDRVLAVTGARHEAVAAALAHLPIQIIHNSAYRTGQSTSLHTGIAALGPDIAAAIVILGDQPFVTTAMMAALVAAWRSSGAAIVAPRFAGRRGNPVIFARPLFADLLAIEGDQGARSLLQARANSILTVDFDDERPLADIDTPEEYRRLAPTS
jgi:molybdenum cofactor cytidylyltransferase